VTADRGDRRIPKGGPCIREDDIPGLLADFEGILRSGRLTQGEYLHRFEEEFAAYVGVAHAVAMSSGTAPLEIALRHWGVQGAEVIVPTNTFAATVNAVVLAGGRPVLADIDAATLCSGLDQIRPLVKARTRGVIAVHIAGLITADMADMARFCAEGGMFLLEDAAHAHGAAIGGRRAGSLGDAAAFSFYPTKVITCGEGGMLTTDDDELAAFARSFRSHGQAADSRDIVRLGSNYRLPELSAALGLSQLRRLDAFVEERCQLAAIYREQLQAVGGVEMIGTPTDQVNPYYKLPVVLPPGCDREAVAVAMRSQFGVEVGSIYWPPCHLQPAFAGLRQGDGAWPVSEQILSRVISLPLFSGLKAPDVKFVCDALASVVSGRFYRNVTPP
jgi:dTDP-4-amino-4,6-dideoxygalactose transaminase